MTEEKRLREMINYLVSHFSGNTLTRTKLVKLLYLADREAKNELGKKISNTKYIKYHYGPYSEDIIDTLDEMDGEEITEEMGLSSDGKFYLYKPGDTRESTSLKRQERALIDQVIKEYGNIDTKELVEKVYEIDDLDSVSKYTPLL